MNGSQVLIPIVAVLAGLLLFAGFWMLITTLLATLTGWPALAAAFPGGAVPAGEPLRGQVLGMGKVREKNVTTLVPCDAGLYLYPMALFRLRRPPVLVPWTQIRCRDARRFLGTRWYVLDLGGITTMQVRQAIGPSLRAHGVQLPVE